MGKNKASGCTGIAYELRGSKCLIYKIGIPHYATGRSKIRCFRNNKASSEPIGQTAGPSKPVKRRPRRPKAPAAIGGKSISDKTTETKIKRVRDVKTSNPEADK